MKGRYVHEEGGQDREGEGGGSRDNRGDGVRVVGFWSQEMRRRGQGRPFEDKDR